MDTCQMMKIHIRLRHHGAHAYTTARIAHYGNARETDDRAYAMARRLNGYSYYLSN